MMRYFKSVGDKVYAYSKEQIDKTARLTEIEDLLEFKRPAYNEALKQISTAQEKLESLEDTEENSQEIEFIEVEIAERQAIVDDFLDLENELSSIQPIVYEMRKNLQNFHEMFDDEIEAYINPPKTHEQLVTEAESQKVYLLDIATSKIEPLQDAVDLDIATDNELAQLKSWKKFRVLVNRVDTSLAPDINWPQQPAE